MALVIARRPDSVFNAQFWAEDGVAWFGDAYNHGAWHTLFIPENGYFQLADRLTGSVGSLVGLHWAPLLSNTLAILAQAAPAAFFVSRRFSGAVPDIRVRIGLALLYLLMPNTREIDANITNVQWHLNLLAALVVISTPSRAVGWRTFDVLTVVLSGLSGPFAVLVMLTALARYAVRRDRWTLVLAGEAAACFLLQTWSALGGSGTKRSRAPLGAGIGTLLGLVGAQVVTATAVGYNGYTTLLLRGVGLRPFELVGAFGLLLIGLAAWRGPLELRLFLFFAAAGFTAALLSPQVDPKLPQWPRMMLPGAGGRYYLLPGMAFLASLVWAALRAPGNWLKWVARAALAVVVLIGVPVDFEFPAYHDFHPGAEAAQFDQLPRGQGISLPVNPPGWMMSLRKK